MSSDALPTPSDLIITDPAEVERERLAAEAAAREALRAEERHAGWLVRVLAWVHKGFPRGVPVNKTPALAYVLRRRLDDNDIAVVLSMLRAQCVGEPVNQAQVEGTLTAVMEQEPDEQDVVRVYEALLDAGFPVETFDTDDSVAAQIQRIDCRLAALEEEKTRLLGWREKLVAREDAGDLSGAESAVPAGDGQDSRSGPSEK